MEPILACDLAGAAYKTANMPRLLDEIRSGSESCQVRICETRGIIISPAGTNDPDDWRSNKEWEKANFYGYAVHSGFLDGWLSLSHQLRELIRDFAGYPITYSAHSRAAAISQLGGMGCHKWSEHHGNVKSLILFASPRAGEPRFCRALEKIIPEIIRYETRLLPMAGFRDPVPHVPLEIQGYDQPGQVKYLRAYGKPSTMHDLDTYRKALQKIG